MIEAAVLAPSGGNVQPWAFRPLDDGGIEVIRDASRTSGLLDADRVAPLLAVGAAIEGMALRASELGHRLTCEPTGAWEDVVARIHVTPGAEPDPLAAYLGHRFTDRRNPARRPLPSKARSVLISAFAPLELHLVEDPAVMARVGRHIGAVERVRFLHPDLHREMWREIRWTAPEAARAPDGISLAELAVGPGDVPILKLLRRPDVAADLRRRGRGTRLGEMAEAWCDSASALGLVTTTGDEPADFVAAGRGLHRGWLTACAHGLSLQPMGVSLFMIRHLERPERARYAPHEIATLEAADRAYAEAFARPPGGRSIMLFRLLAGGPRYAETYRRPLADVIRRPG